MAIFGTLAPFVRNIPVTSAELSLFRAVLASSLIGLFLLVTKQPLPVRHLKKELFLLMCSGASMAVNWILLFEAYKYTTVAIATLSYYFAPVLVTVASAILFHEKLTGKQIFCFIMSTVGLIIVTGITNLGSGSNNSVGILFGLGAAVLYAVCILLNKSIKGVAGIQRTFLQFLAAVAVMIPYVAFSGGVSLSSMTTLGWGCLLIVGLVHTGITYCMYFTAVEHIPGQELAILSYIDPLVAVVIGVVVLGEPLTLPQLIGGAMILGFTLWNEL
jgi:RarD protein